MQIGIDARERESCGVGFGGKPPCELDHIRDRALIANLVYRWTVDLAIDAHRWADRRDEDHVIWQELGVVGRVPVNQHVVKIQPAHEFAPSLQLDVSQRTDRLHASCGKQRRTDRSQAADGVGAGALSISEYEHADRASLAHAYTRAHPDHLAFDPGLDARLHVLEGLTANADWPDLEKVDEAIATDDEPVVRILVAVQLH